MTWPWQRPQREPVGNVERRIERVLDDLTQTTSLLRQSLQQARTEVDTEQIEQRPRKSDA